MYLKDLAASLLRRWYLFLVAIALTAGASIFVAKWIGPTYEQTAGVVLLPPRDPQFPDANRYLALGSLSQAVDVLVRSLQSDSTHDAVMRSAPAGAYAAAPDATTSAPIVVLTSTGKDPALVTRTLDAVLKQVPGNLSQLQATLKIGATNQITSVVVSRDDKPHAVTKSQLRASAAAAVFVLGLMSVSIGALDGWLLRRRRREPKLHPVEKSPGSGAVDRLSERRRGLREQRRDDEDELDLTAGDEDPPTRRARAGHLTR